MASKGRRVALAHVLNQAGAPKSFQAALDYGGGTGQMLLDVDARRRAVFDVSGGQTESGVSWISSQDKLGSNWDLVLSCQVLEHLSDPLSSVEFIASLLSPGGWFYAEVPIENWAPSARSGPARHAWLSWIINKPGLLVAADTISTAFRVKCGFLPPMAFIPMREHLNYFTTEALCALVQSAGLTVKWSGKNTGNEFCVVATRP
jgi:SAM-dependent methyltransferase